MNAELTTLLTAATPISELRGAIPLGLALGLAPLRVYLLAVVGNIAIVPVLLFFLRSGSTWAMAHSALLRRLLTWVFDRTRRIHGERFAHASTAALIVFVAVPLPVTGAWTATIIAFLFEMPPKRAMAAIAAGVLAAGAIVLAVSLGIISVL